MLKLGLWSGHACSVRRLINVSGNFSCRKFKHSLEQWHGAPSCWYQYSRRVAMCLTSGQRHCCNRSRYLCSYTDSPFSNQTSRKTRPSTMAAQHFTFSALCLTLSSYWYEFVTLQYFDFCRLGWGRRTNHFSSVKWSFEGQCSYYKSSYKIPGAAVCGSHSIPGIYETSMSILSVPFVEFCEK